MNVHLYRALRKANRYFKKRRKMKHGQLMSPVRRIEFVAPPRERICAMTFDDGPTRAACQPFIDGREGLTAHLLDVLKKYDSHATFCIIGSTAENYPDAPGKIGSSYAFGKKYDHYACFGQDEMAGAVACPDLLKRIVSEGHEAANHGYRHIQYGPEYFVYRKRMFFANISEVVSDLTKLHDLVKTETGYEITMARPPHYVDRIGRFGSTNAYTAYAKLGYHYLAASVDGGGWMPTSGDYKKDVDIMVQALESRLKKDPDSLSGAVIFQKDGYNLSLESPVACALELQLSLLNSYGYTVVGVGELMRHSPFEDVYADDKGLEAVKALDRAGYVIGFQNNQFKPDDPVTKEQLIAMCSKKSDFMPTGCTDKRPLSVKEMAEIIGKMIGVPDKICGNTRRDAGMAIWDVVSNCT